MLNQSVSMIIQFNGRYLTLPVNPEKIKISRTADNKDIDIIEFGKATTKGQPGLYSFAIESFFPNRHSYFYTNVQPKTAVDFINEIWETENTNNNVAKIIITGIPKPINMYFVINNFDYEHDAGDEDDIPFILEIKQYVPYGVKLAEVTSNVNTIVRASSTNVEVPQDNPNVTKTYTVKSGDCLFNITKKYTGSGSRWRELYELNKSKINNPNLIYPNQVLTLPTGW